MNNQNIPSAAPTAQPEAHTDVRSEGLLPADNANPDLEVAEEVSLDLQSDDARRVGALPPDTPVSKPAEAVAATLAPDNEADKRQLHDAIERGVPAST